MSTWGMRKTVGAIGVAVAIAGVGGAAIAAAAGSGHFMMEGSVRSSGGPPVGSPGRHSDVETGSLHGEYVVADGDGRFTSMISQTGRVTAISPTSVTARSADGFTQTYVIGAANGWVQPPLAVADEVSITAIRRGEAAVITTMRPPLSGQLGTH